MYSVVREPTSGWAYLRMCPMFSFPTVLTPYISPSQRRLDWQRRLPSRQAAARSTHWLGVPRVRIPANAVYAVTRLYFH